MHQALYRKWRPQTFGDVCGQEHITSILEYETENNKFSHAYLFCGSRGTGKTTCAKILAKAVNCESPINGSPCNRCSSCMSIDAGAATDVLEMDAASNNGVDNIRDIRDEVLYSPTALKYRVYIVDEVHMLSGSAFNALLKTLEEPPSHAIFILATTELHKLPSTIVSRCQRYDFRRITTDNLAKRLEYISNNEKIDYSKDALRTIAKMAQGGMRDAISLLELCAASHEKITVELVNTVLGAGSRDSMERTVEAIAKSDFDTIFSVVDSVVSSSKDIGVFWQELLSFYRDMLVIKTTKDAKNYLDLTDEEVQRLSKIAQCFTKETILYHCRILDDTLYVIQKTGAPKRITAEMALIKMCDVSLETSTDSILSRISRLEGAVASGNFLSAPSASQQKADVPSSTSPKKESSVKAQSNTTSNKPAISKTESLKALRGWNEIIENISTTEASALGFLRGAKAFTDADGRVYVKFSNDFAKNMVDKPKIRDAIRASVCLTLKKNLSENDLILGLINSNEELISELDELNI